MPYLGSTLFVLTLVAGLLVSMGGFFLLARALAPRLTAAAQERWERRPVLSTLVGLPLGGVALAISGVLLKAPLPPVKLLGLLALAALLAVALTGASALAARIGAALPSSADTGGEWRRTLRGGAVLLTSFLVPVLGWFVLLPIALFGGVGAIVLGAFALLFARPAPRPLQAVAEHAHSA
jgi:hypothetical protein